MKFSPTNAGGEVSKNLRLHNIIEIPGIHPNNFSQQDNEREVVNYIQARR